MKSTTPHIPLESDGTETCRSLSGITCVRRAVWFAGDFDLKGRKA